MVASLFYVGCAISCLATPRSAPVPTTPTATAGDVSPSATSTSTPEQSAAPPDPPVAPRPTPVPRPAADVLEGTASWYDDGPGLYAAVHSYRFGDPVYDVIVRVPGGDSVRVRVRDHCACYVGTSRERLIDLSPDAFAKLAPLSRGLVRVTVEGMR